MFLLNPPNRWRPIRRARLWLARKTSSLLDKLLRRAPEPTPSTVAELRQLPPALRLVSTPDPVDADAAYRRERRRLRKAVICHLRFCGYRGTGFDQITRAAFRDIAEQAWRQAEDDCRGELTNRAGQARGVDPRDLFFGTEARAFKWASEELVQWWQMQGGRFTYAEYVDDLMRQAEDELAAADEETGDAA